MLYQDQLGRLYEVPENQVYGLGYAGYPSPGYAGYDGFFDTIAKSVGGLVSKALPAVASFIPGGSLVASALPAIASGMAPSTPAPVPAPPQMSPLVGPMPPPGMTGAMMPGMPGPYGPGGMPGPYEPGAYGPGGMPMHRPWPHGWQRPQIPYTGLGPQRLYLRCSTWPGPSGLVPAIAAQAPVPATQAAAAAAAQTASALMRRRPMRHHRRR